MIHEPSRFCKPQFTLFFPPALLWGAPARIGAWRQWPDRNGPRPVSARRSVPKGTEPGGRPQRQALRPGQTGPCRPFQRRSAVLGASWAPPKARKASGSDLRAKLQSGLFPMSRRFFAAAPGSSPLLCKSPMATPYKNRRFCNRPLKPAPLISKPAAWFHKSFRFFRTSLITFSQNS